MKVGDLIQVSKRCDSGWLWHKIGVVLALDHSWSTTKVRVLMENRVRLFDYCSLEVINESG